MSQNPLNENQKIVMNCGQLNVITERLLFWHIYYLEHMNVFFFSTYNVGENMLTLYPNDVYNFERR